ncbi:DNA polymerase III subunit chi [Rhodobacterales bacterium HKCCE3408]|nr:DNA polymerase III subunit chi [Rhodobacterales bacterium HKCCE3408]
MGEVYFYHLTRTPLEDTLRTLLEKSLSAGWRVAVRGRHAQVMERLDAQLWLRPEASFLPHGLSGGPHDADQPVLLTTDREMPNGATALVSIDGADVTADEAEPLARVSILFDGHDTGAVETARAQWRSLTGSGLKAKYWSEESGRWEMKRES